MSLIIMSGKNLPWGKGEEREGEELSGEDAKEEGGGGELRAASATSCCAVTGDLGALIAKLGPALPAMA